MSPDQIVNDEEILYRSVMTDHYQPDQQTGKKRLSSQAFQDRERKISVDIANLCNNDPLYTQKSETDGVTSLLASEVKAIQLLKKDSKGKTINIENVMVCLDPIKGQSDQRANPAHAVIYATPDFDDRKIFNKLVEQLTLQAIQRGFLIEPS